MHPLLPSVILAMLPARVDQILLSPHTEPLLPENLLQADLTVRACIDELVQDGLAYRAGTQVRQVEVV